MKAKHACPLFLFIKTAEGKYGRTRLSVNSYGSFSIKGYLNPSGSQNLEFDPSKRLKPGYK
jgi:hypothetical protein